MSDSVGPFHVLRRRNLRVPSGKFSKRSFKPETECLAVRAQALRLGEQLELWINSGLDQAPAEQSARKECMVPRRASSR